MSRSTVSRFVVPLFLLALVGCGGSSDAPKSRSSVKPDFSLTSDELINEHVRSQTNAKSKYQGKTIQLTGKVFMVWDSKENIVSGPYLHIAHSGSRPDHVAACFTSAQAVHPFSQGKQATIEGKYGGTIKGGLSGSFIVVLKDCIPSR